MRGGGGGSSNKSDDDTQTQYQLTTHLLYNCWVKIAGSEFLLGPQQGRPSPPPGCPWRPPRLLLRGDFLLERTFPHSHCAENLTWWEKIALVDPEAHSYSHFARQSNSFLVSSRRRFLFTSDNPPSLVSQEFNHMNCSKMYTPALANGE